MLFPKFLCHILTVPSRVAVDNPAFSEILLFDESGHDIQNTLLLPNDGVM
jgi:hypothetical protein